METKTLYTLDSTAGEVDMVVQFHPGEDRFTLTIKQVKMRKEIVLSVTLSQFDSEHLVKYLVEAPYVE
jgi:hypothetical protein